MYVYDDQDPKKEHDSRRETAKDDIRGGLKTDIAQREQDSQTKEPNQTPKDVNNDDLNKLERNPSSTQETTSPNAPSSNDLNQDDQFHYRNENKRGSKIKAAVSGKSKKKLFAIFGVMGGVTIFGIIMIIIFVIGLFKIPDLAQHILEFQFARSARMLDDETLELTSENLAYDAAANATEQAKIDKIFGEGSVWSKIKLLNPENMIDNLGEQGVMKLNYTPGKILGINQRLTSLDIGGENIDVSSITANNFQKALHPIDTFTSGPKVAAQVSSALDEVLSDDTGIIARAAIENSIRRMLGIGLLAWTVGDLANYLNKTPAEADGVAEQQAFNYIEHGDPAEQSIVTPINNTTEAADQQLKQDVDNIDTAEALATNGGEDEAADEIIANASNSLTNPSILKELNPASIAVGICVIYDGSLENTNASNTIDEQDNESQRTFSYVESAADQEKYGDVNAETIGSMDRKTGNITESIPEIRADGGTINTQDTNISPQQSPGGETSILTALHLNDEPISGLISTMCPALTSTAGLVITAIPAILALLDGAGEAADAAAAGSTEIIDSTIGGFLSQFIGDNATVRAVGFVSKIPEVFGLNKTGLKLAVGLSFLTEAARLITFTKANMIDNGLSEGVDFDNQAYCGGSVNANVVNQQEFYGVPLTVDQVAMSNVADNQYIASQQTTKSAFQRYLAFSNPDSLMSRFGLNLYGLANGPIVSSLMSDVGKIFNPMGILGNVIGSISGRNAYAVAITDTSDCGVVQWGWTSQELNLIQNDPSYQPAENELIFDEVQKSDPTAISNIESSGPSGFAQCYSDTMGELLAGSSNPLIQRDSNGNVIGGWCTEDNMGPYTTNPEAYDPIENNHDLVFRWRLEQAYIQGINLLNGISSPTGGETLD
ncbi:MAG: hypothetical protein ABSB12_02810 [Candidatus Saccharimonadales bacterium]